jgi:hypothetical protein
MLPAIVFLLAVPGGYGKTEFWKQTFCTDGRTLSWAEALALFRDSTGRLGPATWEQGDYPRVVRKIFPCLA